MVWKVISATAIQIGAYSWVFARSRERKRLARKITVCIGVERESTHHYPVLGNFVTFWCLAGERRWKEERENGIGSGQSRRRMLITDRGMDAIGSRERETIWDTKYYSV